MFSRMSEKTGKHVYTGSTVKNAVMCGAESLPVSFID